MAELACLLLILSATSLPKHLEVPDVLQVLVFFELFRGSVKLGTYHRTHRSKHDGWAKLWWLKLVGVFTSCFFLFLAL
jgi:hypothetical protein